MKKIKEENKQGWVCPACKETKNQKGFGKNRSGTQRCVCGKCGITYTINPKIRAYPEAIRQIAIKEYYAGISAMGVGKIHGFSKANVLNWIKKNKESVDK
jgi:transposase-like protein